ncbi:DEAD/DEAH box helicase [Anseongella ginsenosidimutans]|uniref:DEAD/DEAH box helicase n=1 Tax=Anseongella ginsenosidimutans TaxID=496056 RepID=UPI0011CC08B6|nr:DEAD/DEAH box helicase [Anseongella ginsenosidimutans]QEC52646.1 DEAD/DEAH box helicase [Anseongella ginsenosidimutans]
MPAAARKLLPRFGEKGISELKDTIRRKYSARTSRPDFDVFYRQAALRALHELFVGLKPYTGQVKWYHRVKQQDHNYKTAPCRFSEAKPLLQFDVIREEGRLNIRVQVKLAGQALADGRSAREGGNTRPLADFRRYHFLLELDNNYFLLGYRDFLLLEWLEKNPPSLYGDDPAAFTHHVLARLEESHSVNRNNLMEEDRVDALPVNRLLLSELNGAFLLLTPQWIYDDFLAEGPFTATLEINRGGRTYIIRRNKQAEEDFQALLRSLHPAFEKQSNGYFYLSFADAQKKQWFLKTYHRLQEQDIELTGMDMLQHFRYSPHKAQTQAALEEGDGELLTMTLEVSFGKEKISLGTLQKTLMAGQRAVLLKGHTLGILSDEWLTQYATLIRHGKISGSKLLVPRWMALTRGGESPETEIFKPVLKAGWWEKWEYWQERQEPLYPPPAGMQAALRPYQQKGYEWLLLLAETGAGACLADDMGLGKTLQTIAFLLKRLEQDASARHLVVCPASLIYNWQQELEKFAPGINSLAYHGASRTASGPEGPRHRY